MAKAAGKLKYGGNNWRAAGADALVYLGAMKRHIDRWSTGEQRASDDMTHHLGNVMACCDILLEAEYLGILKDTRMPDIDLAPLYKKAEEVMQHLLKVHGEKNPKHYNRVNINGD